MKKCLLLIILATSYQSTYAASKEQLIKDIHEIVANHYSSGAIKSTKIDAVVKDYKTLENAEKQETLKAVVDMRDASNAKHQKNLERQLFWELRAVGIGTFAFKGAIDSYYAKGPKSSLRSFFDWVEITLSAYGMYAGTKFMLAHGPDKLQTDISKLAGTLILLPSMTVGATKLWLATDNITGPSTASHAGKKTLAWLCLLAACPGSCLYNKIKGNKYNAQHQTAQEIYARLAYA